MKLLLDQGLPRSTVFHLEAMGIAAEHVGDLGLAMAADAIVLDAARNRQAVIVTLDADFHALLAVSLETVPSVIRIRIEGLNGERMAGLLKQVLAAAETEIESGATVSVTEHRIRVRMLPIGNR